LRRRAQRDRNAVSGWIDDQPPGRIGQVFLPSRAGRLAGFRAELAQIPNGRYDDQVDSLSLFLNWIEERKLKQARCGRWR
jgi:phage terminase large subunit-like protein